MRRFFPGALSLLERMNLDQLMKSMKTIIFNEAHNNKIVSLNDEMRKIPK